MQYSGAYMHVYISIRTDVYGPFDESDVSWTESETQREHDVPAHRYAWWADGDMGGRNKEQLRWQIIQRRRCHVV